MTRRRKRRRWPVLLLMVVLAAAAVFCFQEDILRAYYPLAYQDSILKYARMYDLDPYLIAGVIYTESRFREDAVSDAGACGLMQVMPDTGAWIANKIGMPFERGTLFDPDANIQLGCWYLQFLFGRFGEDLRAVLAGYNAGHGRVTEWLQNEDYTLDGLLRVIPYAETETYVERVQHAKEQYQKLYTLE